jgi:hypothetical protein
MIIIIIIVAEGSNLPAPTFGISTHSTANMQLNAIFGLYNIR